MPSTFRLPRHSDVDLCFDGDLLADVSTHEPGKQRWQEVRVYRTVSDRWVVERVGRSTRRGEVDLSDVRVCDTPAAVRLALSDVDDGRRYLTIISEEALNLAADADPDLADALVERV